MSTARAREDRNRSSDSDSCSSQFRFAVVYTIPIRLRNSRAVSSPSRSAFSVWFDTTGTLSGSTSSRTRSSRM